MKDLNENNASELLTLLLDNELDREGIQAVSGTLVDDISLQNEYHELSAISGAIKSDPELIIVPPAEATNAVFKSLGFESPVADRKAIPPLPAQVAAPVWKKALAPAALLLLALVSSFYFTDIFNSGSENTDKALNINSRAKVAPTNPAQEENIPEAAVEDEFSKAEENLSSSASSVSGKHTNNAFANTKAALTDDLNKMNDNSPVENTPSAEESLTAAAVQNLSLSNIVESTQFNIGNDNPEIKLIKQKYPDYSNSYKRGWQLSSRYLAGSAPSVQGFANSSGSILPLNNIALAAILGVSRDFNILVEFGQEDFNRYGTDDANNLILSERSVFWVTTGLRYDINAISFADFKPYLQMNAGASTEGYMIRGSGGVKYGNPSLNFLGVSPSVIIGYEIADLIYKAPDNKYYAPFKHGLTLGLNFHF